MRGVLLFVAGILVGLAFQSAVAQSPNSGIVGLNHVGISVPNLDEAVAYYTKTLGFPEAFRSKDERGQTALVYVQISRNTFVELQPANPQRPPGFSHFGVHVENMVAPGGDIDEQAAAQQVIARPIVVVCAEQVLESNGPTH